MAGCTLVERFNGKLSQYIISAQASQRKFEIELRKCGALIFPLSLLSDPSLDPFFRIFRIFKSSLDFEMPAWGNCPCALKLIRVDLIPENPGKSVEIAEL